MLLGVYSPPQLTSLEEEEEEWNTPSCKVF